MRPLLTVTYTPPVGVNNEEKSLVEEFLLHQNYPNPFNPSTTLSFDVPYSSFVSLKVYDLLGHEMATLANEELLSGTYERVFDAGGFASGVYLYRLQAGTFSETRKLLLMK